MRTRTTRPLTMAALVVAAGLALAACASSGSTSSAGSAGGSSGPTTTASGTGTPGASADCPQATSSTQATVPAAGEPTATVPPGPPPAHLVTRDLTVGSGAAAQAGDKVTVKYVGVSWTCKFIFDASWTDGAPGGTFTFTLGAGQVIPGWDHGIVGMKVGGRRELIIPPSLAYGPNGQPPTIVPNDTLIFVVDLVSVQPPATTGTTTTGG